MGAKIGDELEAAKMAAIDHALARLYLAVGMANGNSTGRALPGHGSASLHRPGKIRCGKKCRFDRKARWDRPMEEIRRKPQIIGLHEGTAPA